MWNDKGSQAKLFRIHSIMLTCPTLLFLLLVLGAGRGAHDDDERLFRRTLVAKTTSVRYVIPTITSFYTVPVICYSTVGVTGSCRRRRRLVGHEQPVILSQDRDMVDIDLILPSPIQRYRLKESIPLEIRNGICSIVGWRRPTYRKGVFRKGCRRLRQAPRTIIIGAPGRSPSTLRIGSSIGAGRSSSVIPDSASLTSTWPRALWWPRRSGR